ncbi:SCO3374 family protein [Streptomyces peucetius]|uniref:SCO3374 family protein n=1 Tax=Streptomyces peucetius TaxID=1950 RepID=A0ABY6I9C9_STRPE|nr:SCO3374 family protein [Streptomyces peucetius]UYQ63616.1 SCO3374 family protein [Streptomyces peucetius]
MSFTVPSPRAPSEGCAAQWYRREFGWDATDGSPVRLATGARFDVLELPADAGTAVLRRGARTGPVALDGPRVRLLVAAGSAEELPGLLDWLEWRGVDLDLTALGTGGAMTAPPPPGRCAPQGAAVWLRPPVAGRLQLPALTGLGDSGGAPDLVRLVDTAATECHRARLTRTARTNARKTRGQPLAFS